MREERIDGATQKTVGAVKEGFGKAFGNDKLKAEGLADKAEGSTKESASKVKGAIHKTTK